MHDANSFWEDTGNKPEKKPVDENLEDLIKELEDSLLAGSKQVSSQIIREKGKQVGPTPGKPQVTKIPDPVSLGGKEGVNISFDHLNQMANLVGDLLTSHHVLAHNHQHLCQSLEHLLSQIQHLSQIGIRIQELNDPSSSFYSLHQEIIECTSSMVESAVDIDVVQEEIQTLSEQFDQVTEKLRDSCVTIQRIPFARASERLRNQVTIDGVKYGKKVDLVIQGQETPVDKLILPHLTDCLIYVLHHAMSQETKTTPVRIASGKSPAGKITIQVSVEGKYNLISITFISVANNTLGINYHRLVQNLLPILHQVYGTISTDSSVAHQRTLTIKLPISLSGLTACGAICCVFHKYTVAFHQEYVMETMDILVKDVARDAQGKPFIRWRERILPLRTLTEVLGFNRQIIDTPLTDNHQNTSVVILHPGNSDIVVALQVDQVLGEREIFVKQFPGILPKPTGLAGVTIGSDGTIVFVADPWEIITQLNLVSPT
jgi:chemosensory pili system protein ChpA (sensor histidine kinase/response regulator)